jgi:dihydrofolate reductase
MKLSIISALSANRVIGKDNALPWHLPADLRFFKQKTMGHWLLMGRRTFESMEGLLRGRTIVVITRRRRYQPEGVLVAGSIDQALSMAPPAEEVFIAGGAEIYAQMLKMADRMYLTLIHQEFEGDTFFPRFDKSEWVITERIDHAPDERNPYAYSFVTFDRQK